MSGTLTTGTLILTASQYNGDGFGRIRTSTPATLYELYFMYDKQPQKVDEQILNSGISTFVSGSSTAGSYISMQVNGINSYVIRQTKEYIPYQPGKSKISFMTGILITDLSAVGVTSRIGTFDSYNGHFFSFNNGLIYVNELSYNIITTVMQSDWNIDPLNGTGPSGITIDFTKCNIFFTEIQWLGVGSVRLGVSYQNQLYYCHRFTHESTTLTPYMQAGKLPIRYEIFSAGAGSSPAEMRMICSTVISEGGFIPFGLPVSFNSTTGIGLAAGSNRLLFALRLGSNYTKSSLKINGFSILLSGANDTVLYEIRVNPAISGAISYNAIDNTNFPYGEYALGGSSQTVSGGYLLQSGLVNNSTSNKAEIILDNLSLLPSVNTNINLNSDVITLSTIGVSVSGGSPVAYFTCNVLGIL